MEQRFDDDTPDSSPQNWTGSAHDFEPGTDNNHNAVSERRKRRKDRRDLQRQKHREKQRERHARVSRHEWDDTDWD